ncbi:MAG TPA: DUF4290 domain-containing protein [Bacteroidales bacterium]|jgi:hypothetical protein|nr:DUF4290 domain-containing protein [Bacteroidales bacterium]HOS57674.1 DUF4290 domain-containing protein [Bacteroidales bacterium]HRT13536.1 DUF4290 domain-containing protein [Bacteroidales bacterium]
MLEYNTTRNNLIIKEYGRNVQKMVEFALQIPDREKRTEVAKAIIKVMSQINPNEKERQTKESLDYWHKLWDHLFIISNYQLDIDAPFPKPERDVEKSEVIHPTYNKSTIRNRTYGRNMENIIKTVAEYPDSEEKKMLTQNIANHLKKLYLTWNRDSVDDQLIFKHLEEMSDGKLKLDSDFQLDTTHQIISKNNLYKKPSSSKNASKRYKRKREKKKKNSGIN